MEFCISSMDPHLYGNGYAQICVCMTRIYVVCLVAMSNVWVLYHMDLRCILVAMLVYSTHGSDLYWFVAMTLVTCVYDSTYWCTTDSYLTTCSDRADIFISWRRLVLKALVYRITLRLMLWGASCYSKILSPSCDKTFDIASCPEIPAFGVKTKWFLISLSYKFPAPRIPLYPGAIPLLPPPIALGP